MRFVYLKSAEEDFRWMQAYYSFHFPEGRKKAWQAYLNSLHLILANPNLGRPFGALPRRRYSIPRTPFVIYYQIKNNRLEIVRVWDTRRNNEHLTLEK